MLRDYQIKIWGYVANEKKDNLSGKEVHLLKKNKTNYQIYYKEVAHTYSNEKGYYEFYVTLDHQMSEYRITTIRQHQ